MKELFRLTCNYHLEFHIHHTNNKVSSKLINLAVKCMLPHNCFRPLHDTSELGLAKQRLANSKILILVS